MIRRALGCWEEELQELVAGTMSMELLHDISHRRPLDDVALIEGEVEEDEEDLTLFHLRFVGHMLGQRLLKHLMYEYGWPFCLAALLTKDEGLFKKTLGKFQEWWACLQALEKSLHLSSLLTSMHRELIWPRLHWYRYVLIKLAEHDVKEVPAVVKVAVEEWADGWHISEQVENFFHKVRSMETSSEGKKVSRVRRCEG